MLCYFQCHFGYFTLQRLKVTGCRAAFADEHVMHLTGESILERAKCFSYSSLDLVSFNGPRTTSRNRDSNFPSRHSIKKNEI